MRHAPGHVGTTDVDVIIGLAVADEAPETYRTLQNNLEKASFRQQEPSFRWAREVDGVTVLIEFLCETDQVQSGRIFRPKGEFTGSKLGAFNVRGARLARHDYLERQIRGERLDNGGQSTVTMRVANILPCTVLKIFSFLDRHAMRKFETGSIAARPNARAACTGFCRASTGWPRRAFILTTKTKSFERSKFD